MTPQDLYCVTFTNEGSKFRAFIGQFLKQKVILIYISTPVVRTYAESFHIDYSRLPNKHHCTELLSIFELFIVD